MKRKVFLMSVALMVFAAMSVNAQRGCDNQRSGKRGNPNPEMKAYIESNVLPVMKIQRQELDKQIDAADKTRLDEIRAELKSMRTIMHEKRAVMRQSDEKATLEQRKEMREHRGKMHSLRNEVEIMSEKYDLAITTALDGIRENAETWKQEMNELRPNQNPGSGNCPQGYNNGEGQGKRQGMGNPAGKGNGHGMGMQQGRSNRPGRANQGFNNGPGRGMPLQRFMNPEGFLLWNPEEPLPFFEEDEAIGNNMKVNLFPNPAATSVQVSLTLDADQTVSIEIMDKDGKVVEKGKQSKASEGIYTDTFDLSKVENGLYFVKVKVGSETVVERLIIQK